MNRAIGAIKYWWNRVSLEWLGPVLIVWGIVTVVTILISTIKIIDNRTDEAYMQDRKEVCSYNEEYVLDLPVSFITYPGRQVVCLFSGKI